MNEQEYEAALRRIEQIVDAVPGTQEGDELNRLVDQVLDYELTADDLKFIAENMKLSGFSGLITRPTAEHVPDMKRIAESARRFGAQQPRGNRRFALVIGTTIQHEVYARNIVEARRKFLLLRGTLPADSRIVPSTAISTSL